MTLSNVFFFFCNFFFIINPPYGLHVLLQSKFSPARTNIVQILSADLTLFFNLAFIRILLSYIYPLSLLTTLNPQSYIQYLVSLSFGLLFAQVFHPSQLESSLLLSAHTNRLYFFLKLRVQLPNLFVHRFFL